MQNPHAFLIDINDQTEVFIEEENTILYVRLDMLKGPTPLTARGMMVQTKFKGLHDRLRFGTKIAAGGPMKETLASAGTVAAVPGEIISVAFP